MIDIWAEMARLGIEVSRAPNARGQGIVRRDAWTAFVRTPPTDGNGAWRSDWHSPYQNTPREAVESWLRGERENSSAPSPTLRG